MLTDDLHSFGSEQRLAYREQVESAGFQIIGLHWLAKTNGLHLTTVDREMRARTTDYLCDLARLCRDLEQGRFGSPHSAMFPPGKPYESAMENAASVIQQGPVLEETEVQIALEPLGHEEGNFLLTASLPRQLQQMIDSDQVKLHLDVKAMSDEGTPIEQIIRDNADAMIHFHANDPNRRGPGMGDVDFVPIFRH